MPSLILHPGRVESELSEGLFVRPPRGKRRDRLAVYIDGYPARVQGAIEESFPGATQLIGYSATHELIARYISALRRHS